MQTTRSLATFVTLFVSLCFSPNLYGEINTTFDTDHRHNMVKELTQNAGEFLLVSTRGTLNRSVKSAILSARQHGVTVYLLTDEMSRQDQQSFANSGIHIKTSRTEQEFSYLFSWPAQEGVLLSQGDGSLAVSFGDELEIFTIMAESFAWDWNGSVGTDVELPYDIESDEDLRNAGLSIHANTRSMEHAFAQAISDSYSRVRIATPELTENTYQQLRDRLDENVDVELTLPWSSDFPWSEAKHLERKGAEVFVAVGELELNDQLLLIDDEFALIGSSGSYSAWRQFSFEYDDHLQIRKIYDALKDLRMDDTDYLRRLLRRSRSHICANLPNVVPLRYLGTLVRKTNGLRCR